MRVRVLAPAKINLFLKVIGLMPNGFHELLMLMERVSLCDELIIHRMNKGVELVMDGNEVPVKPEDNLAHRAARMFIEKCGMDAGVRIEMKKNIPVAAGLGGGSSDAAAVLRGMNALFEANLTQDVLAGLGEQLGSDVPFFCYESPAWVAGRGEVVYPVSLPRFGIVVINPGFPLSTPAVYKKWDDLNKKTSSIQEDIRHYERKSLIDLFQKAAGAGISKPILNKIKMLTLPDADDSVSKKSLQVEDLIELLANDLEEPALTMQPQIAVIKNRLSASGARAVLMSGSGPTVFGIFDGAGIAEGLTIGGKEKLWSCTTLTPRYEKPVREA